MAQLSPAETVQEFLPWIRIFVGRLVAPPPGHRWTSWYRDEAKNRDVGGSFESQHRTATGIDIAPVPPLWWIDTIQRAGLIAVNEGDHLHIQLWPAGALARAGVDFSRLA